MSSGTYQLSSGQFFYIGSSSDFRRRKADHQWKLRAGIHPCQRIQDEFNRTREFSFTPLKFIARQPEEADEDFRNRLRRAEQARLDEEFSNPDNENKSPNASGPNNGLLMKERWKDPEYRAESVKRLREAASNPSEETRLKMSVAKRGARNHNSRPVIVTHLVSGDQTRYESASTAAKFFEVSQQIFSMWINGTVPWPGSGRSVRPQYAWIGAYSARFEGEKGCETPDSNRLGI